MNDEERRRATAQLQRDRDAVLQGQLTGLMLTGAPARVVQREFIEFQAALDRGDQFPSLGVLAPSRRPVPWRVRRWWRRQAVRLEVRRALTTMGSD